MSELQANACMCSFFFFRLTYMCVCVRFWILHECMQISVLHAYTEGDDNGDDNDDNDDNDDKCFIIFIVAVVVVVVVVLWRLRDTTSSRLS